MIAFVCPKCGNHGSRIEYRGPRKYRRNLDPGNPGCSTCNLEREHFRVICTHCGYAECRRDLGTLRVTKHAKSAES